MNQDLDLGLSKPRHSVKRGGAVADIYDWRGKHLLWAPHPAAQIPPGEWVDAVIAAAGGA